MSAINVGAVSVDILPDTSEFASRLRADLRDLPNIDVNVGADTTMARATIDELARNRDAHVDVNVNDALAAAKLDELSRDRTMDLTVREHHISDGFSGGGLGMLGIGALAAPLAAPLGAAALGGAAGIATAGVAGVAGLGVLALGLSGVKSAVDAVSKAHAGAGAAAVASGIAQANAAAAVKSAQMSLSNAIANADYQQITAEQNLASAQQAATQAQQALTTARQQAQQQIQDLTLSVEDGALAQRQANLNVITAKQNLDKVLASPGSSAVQRAQAQLTYDQAVQQVTDLGVRQQRLRAQQAEAVKAGVNGSAQVVSAQAAIAAALQGVANAQRAQANTARQGAASVAAAQLAFQNAQRGAAVASQNTTAASKNAAAALARLTPAGRSFAEFVVGTLAPAFGKLKTVAAAGLLPGIESGLRSLLPIMPIIQTLVSNAAKAMGDLFKAMGKALTSPFFVKFFQDLSSAIGPNIKNLGTTLGNIATAFAGLFQAFLPLGSSMGAGLADLTGKFADFATHLSTNTGFQKFLDYVKTEGPVVVRTLGHLFEVIGHLLEGLAPLGAVVLTVVDAVAKLLAKLSPGELLAVLALATGGVAALMLAFDATPIGLVVAAIALLAAGLVYAWDHSKTFRDIVTSAFKGVADIVVGTVDGMLHVIDVFARVSDFVLGTHFHKSVQTAIDAVDHLLNRINHLGDKPPTLVIPIALTLDPAIHTKGFIGPTIAEGLAAQGIAGPYTPVQRGLLPHRALGGPVLPGHDYWVGENGPELLHATRPGYVSSHADSLALALGMRSSSLTPSGQPAASGGLHIGELNVYAPNDHAEVSVPMALRRQMFLSGLSS